MRRWVGTTESGSSALGRAMLRTAFRVEAELLEHGESASGRTATQ